jgi:hypothetical protein
MVKRLVSHKQRVGDFHGDVSIVVVVRWSLVDRMLESMIAAAVADGVEIGRRKGSANGNSKVVLKVAGKILNKGKEIGLAVLV